MVPVMTDMDPVPCELLLVIRCKCNVSTKDLVEVSSVHVDLMD